MTACGCRVDWEDLGSNATHRLIQDRIVFCPLHAAAERLAALLKTLADVYDDTDETYRARHAAYALLREIGR